MRRSRIVCCATTLLLLAGTLFLLAAKKSQRETQNWDVVGGARGMHYSPLDQINRKNVKMLQRAWQFDSNDQYQGSELECNPLVVDGVLYATTPRIRVIALDAAS